jgi:hypothetical protein
VILSKIKKSEEKIWPEFWKTGSSLFFPFPLIPSWLFCFSVLESLSARLLNVPRLFCYLMPFTDTSFLLHLKRLCGIWTQPPTFSRPKMEREPVAIKLCPYTILSSDSFAPRRCSYAILSNARILSKNECITEEIFVLELRSFDGCRIPNDQVEGWGCLAFPVRHFKSPTRQKSIKANKK